MTTLYDVTNEALRLWITVTGVDPEDTNFWGSNWDIRKINETIRTAQDVDVSGLTTFMILRSMARTYVENHQVSAMALIEREAETLAELDDMRSLVRLLDNTEAMDEVARFQQSLRDTADEQELLAETAACIEDLPMLAEVRLDALRAVTSLRRDTFRHGAKRAEHLRYNKRILKFWNINSLVRAMEVQPEEGISMCLLRDPDVIEYSFFAFAVHDGDNLSVWSDVEPQEHPLQKFMSRSRSRARQLEDRMSNLRFPYQLLDVKFDDEGKHARPDSSGTALVRTSIEAVAIAPLKDLEPDQILWALMMFDLLRFQQHDESLSMTGEDVFLALSGGAQKALGSVEPIAAERITSEVMREQLATHESRGRQPTGANDWMEERYKDGVPSDLYNVFASANDAVLRVGTTGALVPQKKKSAWEHSRAEIAGVNAMMFGRSGEMESDRVWIARYNQAKAVEKLALEEFERRRKEILEWYARAVQKNRGLFIEAACRGRLDFPHGPQVDLNEDFPEEVNSIRWQRFSKGESPTGWSDSESRLVQLYTPEWRRPGLPRRPPKCLISGEVASVWTRFEPRTAEALKKFTNSDLPDVLEHWASEAPYHGNSILDRTDPMDSMIENPWRQEKFGVLLGLSIREFRRQCKAHGIVHNERFQVWIKNNRSREGYWAFPDDEE